MQNESAPPPAATGDGADESATEEPTAMINVTRVNARKALTDSPSRRILVAMRRTVAAALATAGLVAGPTLVVASATTADAQTPGCVSYKEARQVDDKNFTIKRVHRIFETRGRLYYGDETFQSRDYKGCTERGYVTVSFDWDGDQFRTRGVWYFNLT